MDETSSGYKSRLQQRIEVLGTCLCVGLDPHMDQLPPFFATALKNQGPGGFLKDFSRVLIDAGIGIAPAVKFQSAFYEAFGAIGFDALGTMLAYARDRGLITILDAKRGDIASTMAAYGRMAFDTMGADALTVTPYMGLDTVEPLLPWLRRGHGVYIVWVSSNPGGALVQDAPVLEPDGLTAPLSTRLFKSFASKLGEKGAAQSFGLVLGATRADSLPDEVKQRLGEAALLMPGVGAQGATLTPFIRSLCTAQRATLIPQSRSLSDYSGDVHSWSDYLDLVRGRIRDAAREVLV